MEKQIPIISRICIYYGYIVIKSTMTFMLYDMQIIKKELYFDEK